MTTYVEIEFCQNCATHAWCTSHDQSKYLSLFQSITSSLSPLPVQVIPAEHPRMGAFEVRFRSSRGSLLLASKLRSGKWPSAVALYRKVAELLTSADWSISVFARRNEVLGLDVSSSFPFVVKAVLPSSLGALYGVQPGDHLLSIKNLDGQEICDLPNIRAVMAALKTRPAVVTFRRKGEILCPRLEAPIEPPALPAPAVVVPPLALDAAKIRTPPVLPTPTAVTQATLPDSQEAPKTPRVSPRETEYVKADAQYEEDFEA